MEKLTKYAPRAMSGLDVWNIKGWRFKVYGIRLDMPPAGQVFIEPSLLGEVKDFTSSLLVEMDQTAHHKLGFIIIQLGEMANWLLIDWWAYQDICCQILASSEIASSTRFEKVELPLMACVWELEIIHHERQAWVKTMLNDQTAEDYLKDLLAMGWY